MAQCGCIEGLGEELSKPLGLAVMVSAWLSRGAWRACLIINSGSP